jgi:outer membrane protein TolC
MLYEKQKALLDRKLRFTYRPSLYLVGDAGYNSEVTAIDLGSNLPINPPVPDKDRESIGLEIRQLIWDGGITSVSRKMNKLEADSGVQEAMAAVHNREIEATNLYFKIINLTESISIFELHQANLNTRLEQVDALFRNGLRENSDVQLIRCDLLTLDNNLVGLVNEKKASIDQLAALCNFSLDETMDFTLPVLPESNNTVISRNEVIRLETLASLQKVNSTLATKKSYPTITARANYSYGKPGFDMFSTDYHDYYSAGINLSWKLWDFRQSTYDKRIALNKAKILETTKSDLLLTINNALKSIDSELESTRIHIRNAQVKVSLLEDIVKAYTDKYNSGVITTQELLIQSNNLMSARIELQQSNTRLTALQATRILTMGGKL